MEIGGANTSNLYSGNLFSGHHNTQQQATNESTAQVAPASAAKATENNNSYPSGGQSGNGEKSNDSSAKEQTTDNAKSQHASGHQKLSEDDLKQVQELKQRDQEVRTHEAAHLAAAGKYATGGPSFEYKRGPDGRNYAVGGEVSIDTSAIPNDPQATIQKARQIKAAAHAPANPSAQDRQVAASAAQMEAKARQEIVAAQLEERQGKADSSSETRQPGNITENQLGKSSNPESSTTPSSVNENKTPSINITANAQSQYEAVHKISERQSDIVSLIDLVA